MNDALKMQISAFVDGELPENESELLLRRLSQDAELRQLVAHYLEIGRGIRRDAEVPNMDQLRGRIAEALGEEPQVISAPVVQADNRFGKPLAGLAVAASVAVLALVGLQQTGAPVDPATETVAESESYTEPSTDQMLDEMFRHHDNWGGANDILQRVSFEEAELVKVEPRAELVQPVLFDEPVQSDDAAEKGEDADGQAE